MLDQTDRELFNSVISAMMMGGNFIEDFNYKGYTINPDKKHVDVILDGLRNRERFCPCRVQKIPENKCVCEDFINTGKCCCKLWVKEETNE